MKVYMRLIQPIYMWRAGNDGMHTEMKYAEKTPTWYNEEEEDLLRQKFKTNRKDIWLAFNEKYEPIGRMMIDKESNNTNG